MQKSEFLNIVKKFNFIDRDEFETALPSCFGTQEREDEWVSFSIEPLNYFLRATSDMKDRLWAIVLKEPARVQ